jgi:hypothetical protein
MRIKHILAAVLPSTVGKVAHHFHPQPHQHTTAPTSSGPSSEIRHSTENAPVIQTQPLPLPSMYSSSTIPPRPNIEVSSDCKDFTAKNLSLQEMQQLWERGTKQSVYRSYHVGHLTPR